MAANAETLTRARATLENALMSVARDLADLDTGTSVIAIEEMANRIAALKAGIDALDQALTAAERYKPTYFEAT